ncbi:secreted RxLR effector peptide protein, putative [Phytophthora infestans T30-4]|uniref:RxLR effector protein n=1 Tax=Phytophthora infestans (strain T30-4) TaxID=403677 RepID=D0N3N4_PHYIT|nr:secreted RxLR effector peptide protein, putative [Phytophthora infestans T30-4]EEY68988.1 secreted RxLR effector peptide protein, putative [Phytophthora infestans T30-4]|eukprot:XP_002998842.1 secreted RxLR effector peptide protein, putative [Phytophthora infestans T30-4]
MRLATIVALIGLVACCGTACGTAIAAASNSKTHHPFIAEESPTTQHEKRFLRRHGDSLEDDEAASEARGLKSAAESVRKALYKVKFPGWLATGRKPEEVREILKITFPYVDHKNWKILKSYQKAYNSFQNSLHPAGM